MPASRRPIGPQDYDLVKRLHAEGKGRNDIARELGRSGQTVSRLAAEQGLSFERVGATAAATEARKADAAGRRARIQESALEASEKLLGQMFAKTLVYNFGGKENDYNSRVHDEPPFADKRAIAVAVQALANTALRLAEFDRDPGTDGARSLLGDLGRALGAATDALDAA